MDKRLKIGVIGGDLRSVQVAKRLFDLGHDVGVWGIDSSCFDVMVCKDTCEDVINEANVVILPTPPSEDEVRVNSPLFTKESGIKIHKLLDIMPQNALLLGGRMSPRLRDMAAKRNIKVFDYFNSETLLIKNAIPTAEGAIGIAINKMPKTVFGSKIAVLGFGRIGEILALKLKQLGADVTVFARRAESLAKAQSEGMKAEKITFVDGKNTIENISCGYDIVYNTVPYWIITADIVEKISLDTLIVDLASAPGGIDIVAARKRNLNMIHALSLPAKTAPVSAGDIITESILNILKEESLI